MIRLQPLQAFFHILDHGGFGQVAVDIRSINGFMKDRCGMTPLKTALGGQDHFVPAALERPADDLLTVEQAIDRRCVNPDNAQIDRALDGRDGNTVVLIAPPGTAPDGPCAHAECGNTNTAPADFYGFHGRSTSCREKSHAPGDISISLSPLYCRHLRPSMRGKWDSTEKTGHGCAREGAK